MKCLECKIRLEPETYNNEFQLCPVCFSKKAIPEQPTHKVCLLCNESKDINQFTLSTKTYLRERWNNKTKQYELTPPKYSSYCKECHKIKTKAWRISVDARYKKLLGNKQLRGLATNISKEDYTNLISSPCYYCGKITLGVEQGGGLDRLDNSKGYTLDNVVACCSECNCMRMHHYTSDEFKIVRVLIDKMRKQPEQLDKMKRILKLI